MITAEPLNLFLHIPKTGGSSLKEILRKQYKDEQLLEINPHSWSEDNVLIEKEGIKALGNFGFKKMHPSDIETFRNFAGKSGSKALCGHFPFGIHEYVNRPCSYLTLLRKPETFIVSLYFEMCKSDKDVFGNKLVKEFEGLEAFAEHVHNSQTFILSGLTKYQQLIDDPQKALDKAKENIDNCFVYVGTLEKYKKSARTISRKLGWKHNFKIEYLNKGNYKLSQLNPEIFKTISEKNQLDNELYAYAEYKYRTKFFGLF